MKARQGMVGKTAQTQTNRGVPVAERIRPSKISFVIPALNEEGVVGATVRSIPVEQLRAQGLDVEVIVVDNASTDDTAAEARQAGATVVREERRGYGNAYIAGLRAATGDIVVMSDADGTYPVEDTRSLIEPLLQGDADLVTGSRFNGKIEDGAMPWLHRYIGNPLLTLTQNLLFGTRLSETHCGFRAVSRAALERMSLRSPGMEFAHEMLVEAVKRKLRISEVPIVYRRRAGGRAKLSSFRDGWRHVSFLIGRFLAERTGRGD